MDSSDDVPPLTFPELPPRQSQKATAPPCVVPLNVPPFHFSAVGFISAALAKQIMFARGRINQSFPDLESMVQSEIESLVQARRRELLGESVDDNDADSCEGTSTFPVRLPLALNKCNRTLSAFQRVFADLEKGFHTNHILSVAFVFGSSIINPSEILELIIDPFVLTPHGMAEPPSQTAARLMRLISRSLVSSQASIFVGEAKPARMFTLVRLARLPDGYETQDQWREESNFRARCRKGPWLKVLLAPSNSSTCSHDLCSGDVWLRHSVVCKPLDAFRGT